MEIYPYAVFQRRRSFKSLIPFELIFVDFVLSHVGILELVFRIIFLLFKVHSLQIHLQKVSWL